MYEIGKPHPIWSTVECDLKDVERATIKAKILAGTYKLQSNRARINQHNIAQCPLCHKEDEDRIHFLTRCSALETTRRPHIDDIKQVFIKEQRLEEWRYIVNDNELLTQTILDITKLQWLTGLTVQPKVESISRRLCYSLHKQRNKLIAPDGIPNKQRKTKKPKQKTTSRDGAPDIGGRSMN